MTVLMGFFLFYFPENTGDDGDSINHYFYVRYAFDYPFFFFHLWAKPLLVMAAALPAQLGMMGMKGFNVGMALLAAYLSYRVAKQLGIKRAALCIPFLLMMPEYFRLAYSGLTEFLFSFLLIASMLLFSRQRVGWATVLISFTPFSRPEGLLFIGLTAVYLLVQPKYRKYLPLLLVGQVVISVLAATLSDYPLFYFFTNHPNAQITPNYGQVGQPFHYLIGLLLVMGVPLYVAFLIGTMVWTPVLLLFRNTEDPQYYNKLYVLLGAYMVIVAHSIFWIFGLFKTFGLLRNMLSIAPFMAIIALIGFNSVLQLISLPKATQRAISLLLIVGTVGWPFYGVKLYALQIPKNFSQVPYQELTNEAAAYLKAEYPEGLFFSFYPHFPYAMGMNPFDWRVHQFLNREVLDKELPSHSLLVWDDHYARLDGGVSREMLDVHPRLKFIKGFYLESERRELRIYQYHPQE